jgi:hypothetical protein
MAIVYGSQKVNRHGNVVQPRGQRNPHRRQVLDFARFLRQQALDETAGDVPSPEPRIRLNLVPSVSLLDMTGLVALDGDAVADTEALYDGNGRA